ncbi:unnamed protein product [Amoebophrya sp. A25]|nr:unnamed protein product [Amoebophrya sp. A25]|eukprot:GSA25T00017542001.1
MSSSPGRTRGHHPMIPPPGYRFVPKQQHVCGQAGCFTCYDIWCERCESKDRRILELEMRNNELVKHITLLQAKLFPRGGSPSAGSAPSAPTKG